MNNTSKTKLRALYRNIRNSISEESRKDKSKRIATLFTKNFSGKENFFVYLSFGSEVKTGDIIKQLQNKNKKICIPKCDIDRLTMQPVRYCADDFFLKNSYGISESSVSNYFDEKIDVILMPLLTADRFGNRLGFGKGYYDKFVNSLKYKPILIGLCYSEQIYDGVLPNEHHDAKLDYIITESEIIKICER